MKIFFELAELKLNADLASFNFKIFLSLGCVATKDETALNCIPNTGVFFAPISFLW